MYFFLADVSFVILHHMLDSLKFTGEWSSMPYSGPFAFTW